MTENQAVHLVNFLSKQNQINLRVTRCIIEAAKLFKVKPEENPIISDVELLLNDIEAYIGNLNGLAKTLGVSVELEGNDQDA